MNKTGGALFLIPAVIASPFVLLFGWLTIIGAADSLTALRAGELGADRVAAGVIVIVFTFGVYWGARYFWRAWARRASDDEAEAGQKLNRLVLWGFGGLAVFGLLHPIAVVLKRADSPQTATEMLAVGICFTAIGLARAIVAWLALRSGGRATTSEQTQS